MQVLLQSPKSQPTRVCPGEDTHEGAKAILGSQYVGFHPHFTVPVATLLFATCAMCLQLVQCDRFVSALLHAVREQVDVCSRPWLQHPALLQHHPRTPAELCRLQQGSQPRACSWWGRCCWLLYGMLGMIRMSCQRSKGSGLGELGARAV